MVLSGGFEIIIGMPSCMKYYKGGLFINATFFFYECLPKYNENNFFFKSAKLEVHIDTPLLGNVW